MISKLLGLDDLDVDGYITIVVPNTGRVISIQITTTDMPEMKPS